MTRHISIALIVISSMAVLFLVNPKGFIASASESLQTHGNMSEARAVHAATKLSDGKVLITGGMRVNQSFHDTAEIYIPGKKAFKRVSGKMKKPRVSHTATRLVDGRVLIVGGWSVRSAPEASAELFDPKQETFRVSGGMKYKRSGHSSTLLPDGRVLVAGGHNGKAIHDSIEVFDPKTGEFKVLGKLALPRKLHTATLLLDSKILFAGGEFATDQVSATAEILDLRSLKSVILKSRMSEVRYKHDAVLLLDGRVLIFGGSDARDGRKKSATAELFDPKKNEFTRTGDLVLPRFKIGGSSAVLPDGRVFVAGSANRSEIYDPAKGKFSLVRGKFGGEYHFATATILDDGTALVVGGYHFRPNESPRATSGAWILRSKTR